MVHMRPEKNLHTIFAKLTENIILRIILLPLWGGRYLL